MGQGDKKPEAKSAGARKKKGIAANRVPEGVRVRTWGGKPRAQKNGGRGEKRGCPPPGDRRRQDNS